MNSISNMNYKYMKQRFGCRKKKYRRSISFFRFFYSTMLVNFWQRTLNVC